MHPSLVEMEISTATLENVWQFPKKPRMQLAYNPAIVPPSIYAIEMEICVPKQMYEFHSL